MEPHEFFSGLTLEDISVDAEGRVVIENKQVAEVLKAAVANLSPQAKIIPTVNNFVAGGCRINTVQGCTGR
jgi:hypothetical protein